MRPTKYSQDMLDKARDYLETFRDDGSVIPSIAGLALRLKIDRTTPYAWAEDPDKAEFSNILGAILAEQERLLLNNGLTGDFNSAIAKLVLGKHGYHDRVDSQQTTRTADDDPWLALQREIFEHGTQSTQDVINPDDDTP